MIRLKREATVEKEITDHAQSHGWLQYKFTSPGHKGVPDRLFISSLGRHIFLEIKRPGEEPEPLQLREIARINRNKGTAAWFDNSEAAIRFLNDNIAPIAAASADVPVRVRPSGVDAHVWSRTRQDKGDPGRDPGTA